VGISGYLFDRLRQIAARFQGAQGWRANRREARIRRLAEANVVGMVTWNLEGQMTGANEAFLRIVQYDLSDLTSGRVRWTDLTPPEWRDHDERAIAELKTTGVFQTYEKEYFRKDGSRVPVLLGGAFSEDSKNEGVAFVLDLSERKRTEEALRRSQAHLAEAQRMTHVGSGAWAPGSEGQTYNWHYWSEEMFRIFELDPQQGPPTSEVWWERIHPEDRPRMRERVQAALRENRGFEHYYRTVMPDGRIKHMRGVGDPVFNKAGEIIDIVGTSVDLTEQKRIEEALRRSESYLEQAQKLAQIGSYAWEFPSRRALFLSAEWHRMFGFDPKNGTPGWEERLQSVHPEDRAHFQETIDRAIAAKSDYDMEFRIAIPNTPIRFLHSIGRPILSASGEVQQFVGVVMDITASKHAEQEQERLRQELAHLAHLNRVSTIGELTASLAHEIKQPIGAAVTNAEASLRFLNREMPDVQEAREAALEAVRDARRAADIIDRVRSFYQKGSSHQEMVDVNELIREMSVLLQSEASRHSVTMQPTLSEHLPKVMADRVQLQQALMNLMLNGIEAMREAGGELCVKSQLTDDGQLLISVTDAGVGLPVEKTDQIFNAFFTTKSHGTGLGLAITRSIVESHGGRVWASANPGRGSTFQFTLPQQKAAHA
jgi:PAS domain S-box-containing protein